MSEVRLKRLFESVSGGSWGTEPEEGEVTLPCIRGTDFDYPALRSTIATAPVRGFSHHEVAKRAARRGDLIIEKSGGGEKQPVGRIVLHDFDGLVMPTNFASRLTPSEANESRFLTYLMSSLYAGGTIKSSIKQTTGIQNLDVQSFLDTVVFRPSLPEQRAIANFLDAETARIDALIEKKRRLVDLLKARFKLAVDHAIDDLASSEAALGRFVLDIGQGSSPQAASHPAEDSEWGVLKLSAVKSGRYDPQENKALLGEPDDARMVPRVGDLLVTRSNTPAYVGDVAAVTHTASRRLLPDLIYRLRLDNTRISAEFAAYALLSSRSRHEISSLARGSSQSMVKLRGEDIKSLPIPVVAPEVQEQVVTFLNEQRQQTYETVSRLNRQIELLTEHRQALITATVTGQLEVSGAATS